MMGTGCILVGMRDETDGNNNNNKGLNSNTQRGQDGGGRGDEDEGEEEETITLREEGFNDVPDITEDNAEPYRDEVDESR